MRTISQILSATNFKKGLKAYGVEVLSCRQNKMGAILVIESSVSNQEKAIKFFKEFNICMAGGLRITEVRKTTLERLDYGNLFLMD
ncbi:hypothetical protein [Tenacibaculum phage Larrie]|nr:hypothetical protein [Tenacibaculum phage Larrie]